MTGLLSKVIAISGHDGVGKSTLAAALADALPGQAFRIALADDLKIQTAKALNIPLEQVRAKPTPQYLRDYMRALGWCMRQLHGEDYWLHRWADDAQDARRYDAWVICDDVRHVNEYAFMVQGGAFTLTLQRNGTDPEGAATHPLPIIREVHDVRGLNRERLQAASRYGGYIPAAHVEGTSGTWTTEEAVSVVLTALRAVGRL